MVKQLYFIWHDCLISIVDIKQDVGEQIVVRICRDSSVLDNTTDVVTTLRGQLRILAYQIPAIARIDTFLLIRYQSALVIKYERNVSIRRLS